MLHQASRRGKQHVGRHRANDDGIQLGRRDTPLIERDTRSLHRQVRGGNFRSRNMALHDAGSVEDPLVVGLDHPLEILIRQHAWRHITTERADFCSGQMISPLGQY